MHAQISPRKRPLDQMPLLSSSGATMMRAPTATTHFVDSKKTKFEEPIRTRRGPWTAEEDERLSALVKKYGTKKWAQIAELVPGRVGKQCRERWLNHLRTDVKKTAWTEEEDATLIRAQQELGNRWSAIARLLPGRPENSVKNRWNSLCNKRRSRMSGSGDHESVDDSSDDQSVESCNSDSASPFVVPMQRIDARTGLRKSSSMKDLVAGSHPYDVADRGPSPQINYCADPNAFIWSLYTQQQQPLPQLFVPQPKLSLAQMMTPVSQETGRCFPSQGNEQLSGSSSQPDSEEKSRRGSSGLMLLATLCT